MKTIFYKGFRIECTENQAVAFFNEEPKFGTFSQLDKLSAYEKMIVKIDTFLNKQK